MSVTPARADEQERLQALRSYHILDTLEEKDFDDLTSLASVICQVPIALISLVDEKRQWFKSHKGLAARETPIDQSFCAHAIVSTDDITIIEDAHVDNRFKNNPLVTGHPHIKFYAGVPLINEDGYALGTLCVIDEHKRQLSAEQQNALKILGRQVMDKLELQRKVVALERSNEALQNSEKNILELLDRLSLVDQRNRTLIQQAPVAIIVFRGEELVIETVNPPMLELLGKGAGIESKPLLSAIPELTGQEAMNMLYNVYRTGETVQGYNTPVTLHRNGVEETGYFNFTYAPLVENGKISGIIDMAVEVTQQVKAYQQVRDLNEELLNTNEQLLSTNQQLNMTNTELQEAQHQLLALNTQLTESETVLRLAVELASLAMFSLDWQTQTLVISEQYRKMVGFSMQQQISFEQLLETIDIADRQHVREAIKNAYYLRQNVNLEYRIVHQVTGERKWIRCAGKIPDTRADIPSEEQPADIFLGIIIDITQSKFFTEQLTTQVAERTLELQRSNEDLLQFAHVTSHDLKEPVRKIKTFTDRVQTESSARLTPKEKEYLNKIQLSTDRVYSMIDGVLAYSKINSDSHPNESVDLNEIINEIISDLEILILEKKATVSKESLPVIGGAAVLLHQLFYNLVSNALKFSKENVPPVINIRSSAVVIDDKKMVRVSVEDSGIGFDQLYAQQIFGNFTRLNSKDKYEGTGLGLALCKKIVLRHHGAISATGIPGEGAVFTVTLPERQQ